MHLHSYKIVGHLTHSVVLGCFALTLGLVTVSCKREQRRFHQPPTVSLRDTTTQSSLRPGLSQPLTSEKSSYEDNAYDVSEGKRLYEWFNCVGCHAHGGGNIGPPLMDDQWIYGSNPENIFAAIVEGRPNGMPAFRGKIPDAEIWQLVAYVRSLSGQVRKDVASGRDDDMNVKKPEQSTEEEQPEDTGVPKSAEQSS